jgi:alpha-beta hydrolase superfamily lysophospholipase
MKEFKWTYDNVNFSGKTWEPRVFDYVIVIIHSIGEHIGRYVHVADYLNADGYAVTGIDLYGHGLSDGPRGASKGIEFTFDYLSAFLSYVLFIYHKPVILYGHSMGGGLATGFVLKRQPSVRGVIVSSPALLIPGITVFSKLIFKGLNSLVPNLRISQGLDINKLTNSKNVTDAFKNDKLTHSRVSIRLAYEMILNGEWCIENAEYLRIPALVIHGSQDAFTNPVGARLFAKRAPRQLIVFEEWGGGYRELHNVQEKDKVPSIILDWLEVL